jgi:hypothetical protein
VRALWVSRARQWRARGLRPRETAACPVGRLSLTSACEPVEQGSMMRIVGDTLVPVADLADNGRCGSLIPRSERI